MPTEDPELATAAHALRDALSERLRTLDVDFLTVGRDSAGLRELQDRIRGQSLHAPQAQAFQSRVQSQIIGSSAYRDFQQRILSDVADSVDTQWPALRPFQRAAIASLVTATLTRVLSEGTTIQSAVDQFARAELFETVSIARSYPADTEREWRRANLRSAAQESRLIMLPVDATAFEIPTFQLDRSVRSTTGLPNLVLYEVGDVNQVLAARTEPWAALSWWTSWNPRLQAEPIELVGSDSTAQLQSAALSVGELVG